jgi:hypothetical protein
MEAITENKTPLLTPEANYECDVQDEPTCLAEHKTR